MTDFAGSAIRAEGLTVRAGRRRLLESVDVAVEPGEIVLLAGPSGSGKSVFLRVLGGLVTRRTPPFRIDGRLGAMGRDVLADPRAARGEVGIVFQDFALFTGLDAADNVRFALDHRRPRLPRAEADATGDGLLAGLSVPGDARVGSLSGGQKQRVAIARALAFAPRILAYDEPTSGLDPVLRDRVADVIRSTSREHGTTTLVVTHDLAGLLPIADRVLLLDPKSRTLEEVPLDEAEERLAALTVPPSPPPRPVPPLRRALRWVGRLFDGTGRVLEGTLLSLAHLAPVWRSPAWGLRFLGHFLRQVAGPGALLYFLLAGVVIGLVTTYFTFNFLPKPEYTERLILDDMMGGLGFALHRILVPLIMTLLLAARAGSAISADVSTRVAGRQTDAMRSLDAPPSRYLLTGTLWAFLIGTPILSVLAFVGARAASAGVFAVMAPHLSLHAWSDMFHRLIVTPGSWLPAGAGWVAAKNLSAAFGIGAIAYFRGASPKDSPEEVARSITSTVIWATFLVLAIHLGFAFFEF